MIVRKKKSLLGLYLVPAILLLVFAALLIALSLLDGADAGTSDSTTTEPTYEQLDGEGANQRVLPAVSMSQINRISIDNTGEQGKYSFMRYGENNEFYLFYDSGSGTEEVYLPPISVVDSNFSYSSLFSTEAFGETNISQIYNLAIAVGNIRFSERIALDGDEEKREEQLKTYGLEEGSYSTVTVWYRSGTDEENQKYVLHIGAPVVTGVGYYLMVEGRDYIYATATAALDSCMQGYTYYVSSRLTAAGLSEDSTYEPYLTPSFKHWRNTLVSELGKQVSASSRVIVNGITLTPLSPTAEDVTGAEDGYIVTDASDISFSLYNLTGQGYARLHRALVGQQIGDYTTSPIRITLTGSGRVISLGEESESPVYEYRILAVEAVLTEDGEREDGTVGDANELKVTYDLYVDGEKENTAPLHSIIDITDGEDNPIPADVREALRGVTLGEVLDSPITFSITYTTENTNVSTVEVYLEKIIAIYDQNGASMDSVSEDSIVAYRYYYVSDGEKSESLSMSVNLKTSTDAQSAQIRDKFLGLTTEELDEPILISRSVEYEEVFLDFITYQISEICYFVERECIVSFSYLNSSERNPFYGESLYENTTPGKHILYSLNSGTCETVIKILGGVGSSTTTTDGLVGSKTVAVGLTPEIMEEYGLYAHTVYFELPRGIIALDTEDDSSEDYDWYETIGFTLYISEEVNGIRYVGSDMYDTVVEIDASNFVFCDYDFITFWARRQLVLVDVNEIENIEISFDMNDLSGSLRFDLSHVIHDLSSGGTYDQLLVDMTPSDGLNSAVLQDYLERTGGTYVPLDSYYNYVMGNGEEVTLDNDYAGAGYFKEALQIMYFTTYLGMLEEEDRDFIGSAEPIMTLRMKIKHDALPYVFEFYRIDDRRVGVRMYAEWSEGVASGGNEVCDFYVSTYAMKKIANSFLALANAEPIDSDSFGYGDAS